MFHKTGLPQSTDCSSPVLVLKTLFPESAVREGADRTGQTQTAMS